MGTGSIIGITVASVVFVLALVTFYTFRRNARRKRRQAAEAAYFPYSDLDHQGSAYELRNEDMVAVTGMVERKTSWRDQGRSREKGGPRPPTMLESGRAGMGVNGSSGERPTFVLLFFF